MIQSLIAQQTGIALRQVEATLRLFEQGATIPFISRYRKEATGGLDELQIESIRNHYDQLREIEKRKTTILSTIEAQNALTDDLRQRIGETWNATELEDLYLPYKPKRKTRAQTARQRGLEPLAQKIFEGREKGIESIAHRFLNDQVPDSTAAIQGAQDIIAEWISEESRARTQTRTLFQREAFIHSKVIKGKEEIGEKYQNYFDYSEPLRRCSSHRMLALRRGESEGILRLSIAPEADRAIERLERLFLRPGMTTATLVKEALNDCYKRLLAPSIENETANEAKEQADAEAIRVFTENLRQLLLAAPVGERRTIGIDPGFRTGCKVVCLDAQGALIHNETIFPHPPQKENEQAAKKLRRLVEQYQIEVIAIGNGTAGRETEQFITTIAFDRPIKVFVVSESGASIYSASEVAREEFPHHDVTVRGAISIGRRLMDPLAELVKIDAKSIGVGQYQHDVNQSLLKRSLDQTVEQCVNSVGVNLNTASRYLLTYISGLGPTLAQNIVEYRTANGPFRSRKELLSVPRMGAKAFEQCAGFLRIKESKHPLDATAVHPERYGLVEQMAADLGCKINDLIDKTELRAQIDLKQYITDGCGLPTLTDILRELEKPGLDPRTEATVFSFDPTLKTFADVHVGQLLPGIVTNITNFGCFVDLGIKEKGLCHISQMADRYVDDPTRVVSLHQQVEAKVIGIDTERGRIQLSFRTDMSKE